jgi:hypothetical protein
LRTLRFFNQLVANFDVIGEWRAWAQLPEPLFGNQIRQSPKAEYENVNGVSFAGRRVFDEITPASGTVILNERLTRLDLDSTPVSARPAMAVLPNFAIHGKLPPAAEVKRPHRGSLVVRLSFEIKSPVEEFPQAGKAWMNFPSRSRCWP